MDQLAVAIQQPQRGRRPIEGQDRGHVHLVECDHAAVRQRDLEGTGAEADVLLADRREADRFRSEERRVGKECRL